MYCDKWEDWTDCCRNNTDRFHKVDSLRSFHENSSDNANDSDNACSSDDADSSDDEDDLSNSTTRLMTVSVMRLMADLTARTRTDLIMILIINSVTTLMTNSALRLIADSPVRLRVDWLDEIDWALTHKSMTADQLDWLTVFDWWGALCAGEAAGAGGW